jgi:hypothetical protein
MNKKAETENLLTMALIIAVVIILIIFGSITIVKTISHFQDLEVVDFSNMVAENIKQMSASRGSRVYTYEIPSKVKTIVFLDLNNPEALKRHDLIKSNALLRDSVETGDGRNLFLFSANGNLINSFNIGDITVGQFGDSVCDSVGIIDVNIRSLDLRVSNLPGTGIFLGEECEGLNHFAFQGPFNENVVTDVGTIQRLQLTSNRRQITLIEDEHRQIDYQSLYFENATLDSTVFDINSNFGMSVDRIFFSVDTPGNTNILFRVGFRNSNTGDWNLYGSNITATSDDIDYYYIYSGQYITEPDYDYNQVKVQILFLASNDLSLTPRFNWLRLSYFD